MSLTGTMLRVRKWIQRIPLTLNLRADYKKRWGPQTGCSWEAYVRAFKEEQRHNRRAQRLESEINRWKEAGVIRRPICTWLPTTTRGRLPYVCPDCKRIDSGHAPLLVLQTIGVWLPDGTRSPWVYTALTCFECGLRRPEDSPYIPYEDLRVPRESHFAREESSYHVTYTVTSKSGHERHRRQIRHRGTHALLDTRAEAVRLGDRKEGLNLETVSLSPLTIDQVTLDDAHPLSYVLLPILHAYEKERATKGRW
jgi:hypothetical protein